MNSSEKHPEERRSENRRTKDRQGKFDRRRNRCRHCKHFSGDVALSGQCTYHQKVVPADMFACPVFAEQEG
ncbi:MAG: hypothetical protein KTR14_07815 [Vampirovibrio sp.]|nr:hypothetical protein [Vampirovibrio sp.]